MNNPPIIDVNYATIPCPHCRYVGKWKRGGTTRPNPTLQAILKYRTCPACGMTHYQSRSMTPEELVKYLGRPRKQERKS